MELARCLHPRVVILDVVLVMQHGVDEDRLAEIDPDDHLVFFSYLGIVNLEASFVIYSRNLTIVVRIIDCSSTVAAGAKVKIIDQVVCSVKRITVF